VAVTLKLPPGEIVTLCEESTPEMKEGDVPPPEVRLPVDVIITVSLNEVTVLFTESCATT
jgi:hypothetical protein